MTNLMIYATMLIVGLALDAAIHDWRSKRRARARLRARRDEY